MSATLPVSQIREYKACLERVEARLKRLGYSLCDADWNNGPEDDFMIFRGHEDDGVLVKVNGMDQMPLKQVERWVDAKERRLVIDASSKLVELAGLVGQIRKHELFSIDYDPIKMQVQLIAGLCEIVQEKAERLAFDWESGPQLG